MGDPHAQGLMGSDATDNKPDGLWSCGRCLAAFILLFAFAWFGSLLFSAKRVL